MQSAANRLPRDADVIDDVTDDVIGLTSPQIRITPCDALSPFALVDAASTAGLLGSDYYSDPDVSSDGEGARRRALSCSPTQRDAHFAWSRPLEGPRVRIPRDPTQPSRGSISDVHSDTSAEDEDADLFEVFHRPRSRTCPEEIMRRRRSRMRTRDRPPTPPPGFAAAFDRRACLSPTREKFCAPSRSLPELPEVGVAPPPVLVTERWSSAEDVGVGGCGSAEGQDWTARRVDEWMASVEAAAMVTRHTAEDNSTE